VNSCEQAPNAFLRPLGKNHVGYEQEPNKNLGPDQAETQCKSENTANRLGWDVCRHTSLVYDHIC